MATEQSVLDSPSVKPVANGATDAATLPQRYDAMCRAIDLAYEVDEVKDIRDKAMAFEVYAKQARNTEAERRACEIRLRAERKTGELLREREKARGAVEPGTNRGATRSTDPTASPPTLRDLGISKQQSSDWQRLAEVPKERFEAALADPAQKPTTSAIIRTAPPQPPAPIIEHEREPVPEQACNPSRHIPPGHVQPFSPRPTRVTDDATWICGRLRDFEREGLLKKDPDSLLITMTAAMLEDVEDLAPQVIEWLARLDKALCDRGGAQ